MKQTILFSALLPALLAGCESGSADDGVDADVAFRTTFVVNTLSDIPLPPNATPCTCAIETAGAGTVCSLRAAVQAANACPGHDTINFVFGGVYQLTVAGPAAGAEAGDLDITDTVTIQTVGAVGVTVDARAIDDRVFDVQPGSEQVWLAGFKVDNGLPTASDASAQGGCIRATESRLTLSSMVVGGDPSVTLPGDPQPGEGCIGADGGGIAAFDSVLTASSTKIAANRAVGVGRGDGVGGGVYAERSSVSLIGGYTLLNNADAGGGFYVHEASELGSLSIDGTTVTENVATNTGGGGFAGVQFEIVDAWFTDNTTAFVPGRRGGGLFVSESVTDGLVVGTEFEGNAANEGGGLATAGSLQIEQSRFDANQAVGTPDLPGRGGGMFIAESGSTDVLGVSITRNSAQLGAGVYSEGEHIATNATYSTNEATVAGGGLYVAQGNTELLHTTIRENIAPDGGGIFAAEADVRLDRSILADNVNDECSGVVANLGGNVSGPVTCLGGSWTPAVGPWLPLGGQAPLPFTDVVPICPPNSALDLASPCGVSFDQRGAARPEECDAGSYELTEADLENGAC